MEDCFKGINGIPKNIYSQMSWDEAMAKIFSRLPNRTTLEIETAKAIVVNKCRESELNEESNINEIINEVSNKEEQEVCKYINTTLLENYDDGFFKPSCENDEDDFLDWLVMRHYKFCPYCGKKIKLIDEE